MDSFISYRGFDEHWLYAGPWLWWLVGLYLCLPLLAYLVFPFFTVKNTLLGKRKTISIFVLGDLGHLPRMSYHALSFSKLEYFVNLCGYVETTPSAEVLDHVNIEIHDIAVTRNTWGLPFVVFAAMKVAVQILQLFQLLFRFRGSDYVLIQNPPSMPILLVAIVFIKIFSRNTQLIIDWHNLNYTILNLKFNNLGHPLVRVLRLYEKLLGRWADIHITVTRQMKEFLVLEFGFNAKSIITLHDRPAEQFIPFGELGIDREEYVSQHPLFEDVDVSKYKILVSSTSFTPDEDFNVLLDALKEYDSTADVPPILLIVTGKGPLKAQFTARVAHLAFKNVVVRSAWLSAEDYPIILSLADMAVSLHTSSSGIDLPMKIVDFFGVGVPVITVQFPAIGELVKDGDNGLVTKNKVEAPESREIHRLLVEAFTDEKLWAKIKAGALRESEVRWDNNWDLKMKKRFEYDY